LRRFQAVFIFSLGDFKHIPKSTLQIWSYSMTGKNLFVPITALLLSAGC